jgi:hypothetical protein
MAGQCPHLRDEYTQYSYPEVKIDDNAEETPMDCYNHCMDALRYCITSVYNQYRSSIPTLRPYRTHLDRAIAGEFDPKRQGPDEDWYNGPKPEAPANPKPMVVGSVKDSGEEWYES